MKNRLDRKEEHVFKELLKAYQQQESVEISSNFTDMVMRQVRSLNQDLSTNQDYFELVIWRLLSGVAPGALVLALYAFFIGIKPDLPLDFLIDMSLMF